MEYDALMYTTRDRTAYITLNRPASLNAIGTKMARELDAAFEEFDADDEVWIAIVSGNGRCFSGGADVKEFVENRKRGIMVFDAFHSRKDGGWLRSRNYKPVIAAVHGYCYGSALSLVHDADILVASEDAKFAITEVQLGLGAGSIGVVMSYFGCGRVGTELALTGRDLSGAEGFRLGYVNRLVSSKEELLPAADEMAQRILQMPPLGVRNNVRICRAAKELATDAVRLVGDSGWLARTEDHAEAIHAFASKRQPMFNAR